MSPTTPARPGEPDRLTATETLAKYGIARVPVDYFHIGEYRYTSLDDAIAEAVRRRPAAA